MKTLGETKKGLEVCATLDGDCESCPYDGLQIFCADWLRKDALAYIQQLEAELETVKRERDAAVKDMEWMMLVLCHNGCFICKNRHTDKCFWKRQHRCEAKWRGVCPENAEEEK
jgi:hypothetical protein